MFRKSASAISNATLELFKHRSALAIMVALYALLLTCTYAFVTTREATATQVAITVALTLVAPLLFFTLQTAAATYSASRSSARLITNSVLNSWKLVVTSLPVIGISLLSIYLLNKVQGHFPAPVSSAVDPYVMGGSAEVARPIHWGSVMITSLRYLFLGVLAPLMLIHFWISASQDGLIKSCRGFLTDLARAFAARSVLIYMAGFVIFAVVPYFLLFRTTTTTRAWLEIGLFAVRLTAAFCLTLFGWVITVRSLSLAKEGRSLATAKDA